MINLYREPLILSLNRAEPFFRFVDVFGIGMKTPIVVFRAGRNRDKNFGSPSFAETKNGTTRTTIGCVQRDGMSS